MCDSDLLIGPSRGDERGLGGKITHSRKWDLNCPFHFQTLGVGYDVLARYISNSVKLQNGRLQLRYSGGIARLYRALQQLICFQHSPGGEERCINSEFKNSAFPR